MWLQHILMSNSWPSLSPSCDQTILPCWKVWTWRFWLTFGRDGWGIDARRDFFLHVMVGGDGGVVGPKELVGWVGTVTDSRAYAPPTPRFTEVEAYFLPPCRNIVMDIAKPFYHKMFPQRTIRAWSRGPL
jgi:hypothetical protein